VKGGTHTRLPFPLSTEADLQEELERVDRQLDNPGVGQVVDPAQYAAHKARLQRTRRQVLDQLAHVEAATVSSHSVQAETMRKVLA
jgi:hypothetical protein